eukprot:8331013-Alexandrium_andersonii.AAC.1
MATWGLSLKPCSKPCGSLTKMKMRGAAGPRAAGTGSGASSAVPEALAHGAAGAAESAWRRRSTNQAVPSDSAFGSA